MATKKTDASKAKTVGKKSAKTSPAKKTAAKSPPPKTGKNKAKASAKKDLAKKAPSKAPSKKVKEVAAKKSVKKGKEAPAKKPEKKDKSPKAKAPRKLLKESFVIKKNNKTAKRSGDWKVDDLVGAPYNPRVISEKELAGLQASIASYGDLSGVVFNRSSGFLISGHQRMKTTVGCKTKVTTKPVKDAHGTVEEGHIIVHTDKGIVRIPLRVVDWDDYKAEMAANIAANAHGGSWDHRKLSKMTEMLETKDFDIHSLGLSDMLLRSMSNKLKNEAAGGSSRDDDDEDGSFPEYDTESFDEELTHTCPRCSFRF